MKIHIVNRKMKFYVGIYVRFPFTLLILTQDIEFWLFMFLINIFSKFLSNVIGIYFLKRNIQLIKECSTYKDQLESD